MNFKYVMKKVLVDKATDFKTRSDRPEYWWFTLYASIILVLAMLIDNYVIGLTFFSFLDPFGEVNESGILTLIWLLVTLVQSISVTARRLHDRGHSGWWQLMFFIPILNLSLIHI